MFYKGSFSFFVCAILFILPHQVKANDAGCYTILHDYIIRKPEDFITKAQNGDADTQTLLGNIYFNGSDNSGHYSYRDYSKAAEWYLKAANQGVVEAQGKMASLYEQGKGVEQNYAEAYFWDLLALKYDLMSNRQGERPDNTAPRCEFINMRQAAEHQLTNDQKSEIEKRVERWKPILSVPDKSPINNH